MSGGGERGGGERDGRLRALAIAAAGAVVLVAAIVVLSETQANGDAEDADLTVFEGVEQSGLALGDPEAPVTLHEFVDMQCPFCADFSHDVLPRLIEDYVAPGDVRVELQLLAFIGEDSEWMARAVAAAAGHDRAWQTAETLFAGQGAQSTGYATDDFVNDALLGAGAPPLDELDPMAAEVEREIARAHELADELGVESTPTLVAERGAETATIADPLDYEGLSAELDRLLGRAG